MLSTSIRRNKFTIVPYYKGFNIDRIYEQGDWYSISYKQKLIWLKTIYDFGCKNIEKFNRFRIKKESTIDETILFMTQKLYTKMNIDVKFQNKLVFGRIYDKIKYDIYCFPLKIIHENRKDLLLKKYLLMSLGVLARKGLNIYNDYNLEHLNHAEEWTEGKDEDEYGCSKTVFIRYKKFVKPIIDNIPENFEINYKEFKAVCKRNPDFKEFFDDILKLEKTKANIYWFAGLNIGYEEDQNGYIDFDELFHCTWDNYNDYSMDDLDGYMYFYLNERMNNYAIPECYLTIFPNENETYEDLLIKEKNMEILIKILNQDYACFKNR